MTLYFIGMGLSDERDITLKGYDAIKRCQYVYLECYTSKLNVSLDTLGSFLGKDIILADRDMVEKNSDDIIDKATDEDVAFLVVGDIFGATTHIAMVLEAKEKNIQCEFIHNASVINAVGLVGLELYKYGKVTSVPFKREGFTVETPYNVLKDNLNLGLHTLILLDLSPMENKFLTVQDGIMHLLSIESKRKENVFTENTLVVGCARLGGNFKIKCGKAKDILLEDFGEPLHCFVVPGKLHFMEEDALKMWE